MPHADGCLVYLVGVSDLLRLPRNEVGNRGLAAFHGPTYDNLECPPLAIHIPRVSERVWVACEACLAKTLRSSTSAARGGVDVFCDLRVPAAQKIQKEGVWHFLRSLGTHLFPVPGDHSCQAAKVGGAAAVAYVASL